MARIILDKTKYGCLGPLILQLRFESPATLLEQSYRAEHLIRLIEPDKSYPYDYICYKLTDYKSRETAEPRLVHGCDLIRELATFISQVTRQNPQPIASLPETALSVRQIVKENDISAKTLKRWMKIGLIQRLAVGTDGICQNVILATTWQWFVSRHEKLLARASAFTRLTACQRQWIVNQARKLHQTTDLSRNQIELQLASKTHRARETIRYILKMHDADAAPDQRIFPVRAKLTDDTCRQIFDMFRRGVPMDQLARIYGRSEPTIYRLVSRIRQDRWRTVPIEYIYSPEFDLPAADQTILNGLSLEIPHRNHCDQVETLTAVEERNLFRAYNYLKWKQDQIRKSFGENQMPTTKVDELDDLQQQVDKIKNKLILTNQALVISIAKHHLNSTLSLDELVSEGLGPLMKAVEKFDYTKGFKFSTYASWAVMKHFARIVPLAGQQQHQYLDDEELDRVSPPADDVNEDESYQRSRAVQDALDQLNDRERSVLENRYGIDRQDEPLSLSLLGQRLGVTKERVRQIEAKAMNKLHSILKKTLPDDSEE